MCFEIYIHKNHLSKTDLKSKSKLQWVTDQKRIISNTDKSLLGNKLSFVHIIKLFLRATSTVPKSKPD